MSHATASRALCADACLDDDLSSLPVALLSPAQHASLILPPGSKGMLVFGRWECEERLGRRGEPKNGFRYRQSGSKPGEFTATIDRDRPVYVSMSAFRPSGTFGGSYQEWPDRRLGNVLQYRAVWVEIDFYKVRMWASYTPSDMVWHVLNRLHREGLPAPSYIVCSGRGLHVVWLTEGVPSVALRAWQALQGRLNTLFSDMGADTVAANAAANLRLTGFRNKGLDVVMLWPAKVGDIQRFDFRALCESVLPYTPEQCREYRAKASEEKAQRKATGKARVANGGSPALTVDTYRATMEADLWKLLDATYPEGEDVRTHDDDDGSHGKFLFAFARLWACRMGSEDLKAEVERFANRLGFDRKAALREAGCVIRRLQGMERGEARKNKPGTGPYRYGPLKFVAAFGVTVEVAKALDLRVIRPLAMKAERAKERQAKTRAAKGAKPRAEAKAARLEVGHKALALRAEGLTRARLCEVLGVQPTYLDKAIAEAKANPVAASKPVAASPAAKSFKATSRVSSRHIEIVENSADALADGQVETYNPPVRDEAAPHWDRRPVASERTGGPSHVQGLPTADAA